MKILKKHYFKIINPKIAVQTCLKKSLIYDYFDYLLKQMFKIGLLNVANGECKSVYVEKIYDN